jgi:hypothetical protein
MTKYEDFRLNGVIHPQRENSVKTDNFFLTTAYKNVIVCTFSKRWITLKAKPGKCFSFSTNLNLFPLILTGNEQCRLKHEK